MVGVVTRDAPSSSRPTGPDRRLFRDIGDVVGQPAAVGTALNVGCEHAHSLWIRRRQDVGIEADQLAITIVSSRTREMRSLDVGLVQIVRSSGSASISMATGPRTISGRAAA
jgi:hypothetical protein